ncbi:hypothetical protein VP01_626g11 [Puccinia sorghi]|uniref:Uncharacterized protein n=1 Tax=Puccinia sorghi TaxID=27349 RepID=A0A0L6UII4_9BASI|nr:hypothetical protein VP01_626g11 [Puccinia sorghi]
MIQIPPTGNQQKTPSDPNCPTYECETKMVQTAMDSHAHVIACNDSDSNKDKLVFFFTVSP